MSRFRFPRDDDYDRHEERRASREYADLNGREYEQYQPTQRPVYEEISASSDGVNPNFVVCTPRNLADVQKLINNLKHRQPALVDIARITEEEGQRVLDFLSGAIYALSGSMHRVSGSIFLFTPEGVNITIPVEFNKRRK